MLSSCTASAASLCSSTRQGTSLSQDIHCQQTSSSALLNPGDMKRNGICGNGEKRGRVHIKWDVYTASEMCVEMCVSGIFIDLYTTPSSAK